MKFNFLARIRFISAIFLLAAFILVAKMYWLQILHGADFASEAEKQYTKSVSNIFDRGSIYFETKNGDAISAATVQNGFALAISPKTLTDTAYAYKKINEILPLNIDIFLNKSNKKNTNYQLIEKKIDNNTALEIQKLKIPGVIVSNDRWRLYPGGKTAANILGFVGYQGDSLVGRYGLEQFYESTLKRSSESLHTNFFAQMFSDIKQSFSSGASIEGDIYTTIEPTVQNFLEQTLDKVESNWSSEYSGGIIINPMNGEIYAMAISPSFDPNFYQNEKNLFIFSNPLIDGSYEMGSIIKPITIASGIDSGAIKSNSTFNDKGFVTLDGYTIGNHGLSAQGVASMQDILNKSLNTGVTYVMQKMGKDVFVQYLENFGLSQKTGIDLSGEVSGRLGNMKTSRDIESANASFGQGIALTPIATARALSVLANGGNLITPHIVKRISFGLDFGGSRNTSSSLGKQVIKKETSEAITKMLVNVVDVALKNGTVKIPNYSVAAKTGTAQIARPKSEGGGYYDDRYLHSFFGYFPAYNPKFMIFLFTYYPKKVDYASETLTTSFIDLVKFLTNYYNVPPDR